MNFKNAVSLLVYNFSNVYKMALYRVIVLVITLSLAAALILPSVMYIIDSSELEIFIGTFREIFSDLFSGKDVTVYGEILNDRFTDLLNLISSKKLNLTISFIAAFFIMLVYSFLNCIAHFAFGGVINDHMSTLSHIGFTRCLIRNLKSASLYCLLFVLIKAVYYAIVGILLFYLLIFLLPIVSVFAFSLLMMVIFMASAFKQTVTGLFMPAMITGEKKVAKAFRMSFELPFVKGRFWKMFSGYLICAILIFTVNLVFGAVTWGAALLITVPLSNMLVIALSFVNYYSFDKRKYYLTYDNIVVPKELREEEKYLNEMDI